MDMPRLVARSFLPTLTLAQACHASSVQKETSLRELETTALTSAGASGVGRQPLTRATTEANAGAASLANSSAKLAPLAEAGTLIDLEVPEFREAVVAVPARSTQPKPVVLALHGNYDRPEWQCEVMRDITKAYSFILCPRGIPRRDAAKSENRWEYGSIQQLKREIDAGLSAMRSRFAGHVAEGPIVFTGFSLGAILGRAIVTAEPDRFPRVVFTEGGGDGWNFKQFKQGGGLRVVFGCAQNGCAAARRNAARQASLAGVEVHIADGGNIGHTYDGKVARAIQAEWTWLVEGDERWRQLEP
jgi:dienelactone hydrolase